MTMMIFGDRYTSQTKIWLYSHRNLQCLERDGNITRALQLFLRPPCSIALVLVYSSVCVALTRQCVVVEYKLYL